MYMDIHALLQPVSAQSLCGEDLSFSQSFYEIKQAKIEDDLSLDQGDWVSEPKCADWEFVAKKVETLLVQRSKDIRLLTWLTEAWAYQYGYVGIVAGLDLTQQMLQKYWDDIHPQITDHDLEQRLSLLQGLINQLPLLVKKVPLHPALPYRLLDYEYSLYQHNNQLKQSTDLEPSAPVLDMEKFEQQLNLLSSIQRDETRQKIDVILQHWVRLKQQLEQLLVPETLSFSVIDTQLEMINRTINKIYKLDDINIIKKQSISSSTLQQQQNSTLDSIDLQQSDLHKYDEAQYIGYYPKSQNHLQNREQALQMIKEIADYFAQYEPHSPVSYLLKQSIQYSQLPLHQWLALVIKNESSLESIQELLGVKNDNNPSSNW